MSGAMRSFAVIFAAVAIAVVVGRRLNLVFAVLRGTVGAALVCWFPAAILVSDGKLPLPLSAYSADAPLFLTLMDAPGDTALDDGSHSALLQQRRSVLLHWVAATGLIVLGILAPAGMVYTIAAHW